MEEETALQRLAVARERAEEMRVRADELLDRHVDAARAGGASWNEIGCVLGTSKQAAQQRFGAIAAAEPFGLTDTAAAVLANAVEQARELGHHYVAPEHLVLGLLAFPQELAGEVLLALGVTRERALARVVERLGSGPSRPAGTLGVAPTTKRLLEHAHAIARSLGHRCPRTEHILLAATARRLHSPAGTLLSECGANPDQVRDQLARMLLAEAPELARRIANHPGGWMARPRLR